MNRFNTGLGRLSVALAVFAVAAALYFLVGKPHRPAGKAESEGKKRIEPETVQAPTPRSPRVEQEMLVESEDILPGEGAEESQPPLQARPARLPGEPATPPPIPESIPEPPEPAMGWATATITIGDETVSPPNAHGRFPPIRAGAGQKVGIHVQWPKAKPGTPVVIEVPNMGILDNGAVNKLARVNDQGQIDFDYTTGANPGMCLVVLRSGFEETSFKFWVPSGLKGYDGPFGDGQGGI